jgi:hypothetical protein
MPRKKAAVLDGPTYDTLTVPAPKAGPADWNADGVVIRPGFFAAHELAPYRSEWLRNNTRITFPDRKRIVDRPLGWPDCTPYMDNEALRGLCCDGRLAYEIGELLGEPAGVHLNLTPWVSTERDWHQDSYLNPPFVGDQYAAVWIALDEIDANSGPFEYVPGSHRWPQVTRDLVGAHVDLTDPNWPKHSEAFLTPIFEAEIKRRKAHVVTYTPNFGDLLIWHGRLLHRGSRARIPGLQRPALIAHYSGINHRPDMPPAVQHVAGGWYFPIRGGTTGLE